MSALQARSSSATCRKFTGGLWVGICARPKGSGHKLANHKSITGDMK